jgi:hypothetical protein
VSAEDIEAQLGQYNADSQHFSISLRSKTRDISFTTIGNIPLQPSDAKAFKQQWGSGLVRVEAKGKPGAETATLSLANDADNTRLIFTEGAFVSSRNSENLKSPTSLYRVSDVRGGTCYFLIKSWGRWKVSRTGNLNDDNVEKVCINLETQEINLAIDGDGRKHFKDLPGIQCESSVFSSREKDGYILCNSAFFSAGVEDTVVNVIVAVGTLGISTLMPSYANGGGINQEKLLDVAQSSGLIAMAEQDRQIAIEARRMATLEKMALE